MHSTRRFVDERRKDYFVMYVHHVATIMLVGVSWMYGYWRIGLIVVFIHDISDVFVDALKMVNYLKLEGRQGWFASEIAYVLCVLSWLYWRLYEYPFRVIPGAYHDVVIVLGHHPSSVHVPYVLGIPLLSPPDTPYLVPMMGLLYLLQALHIYWFHLFLMIGYRILTESAREASRQEYEGDSDDGGEGPNMAEVEGVEGSKAKARTPSRLRGSAASAGESRGEDVSSGEPSTPSGSNSSGTGSGSVRKRTGGGAVAGKQGATTPRASS